MKELAAYRDAARVNRVSRAIQRITTRSWTIMEVCGGQTHSIVRYGLDELLPTQIRLIHGPGCPVCVTPVDILDQARELSLTPGVVLATFGDMLRVPGSNGSLSGARALGASVRIVYSPLDAVRLAREEPEREIVFFAVGFETTAPAVALAVKQAAALELTNLSFLISHVLVPPALEAILGSPGNQVQGFLAAGHVCAVMGYEEYEPIASAHRVPIVVTGFEPLDILQGVFLCVQMLERGRFGAANQYARAVRRAGNESARALCSEVFTVIDREWRGIGGIPKSGLGLAPPYARFDARARFVRRGAPGHEDPDCQSGQVLQGVLRPDECPAFGVRCTPEKPLGAPMVSGEGACAAYFRYRRRPSTRARA